MSAWVTQEGIEPNPRVLARGTRSLPTALRLGVLSLAVAVFPLVAQPATDSLAPAATRPVWRVGVEMGSAYERDVRFIGDGAGDRYDRMAATLAGGLANSRWRAELDARGESVRFATIPDLDRTTYDVGLTLSSRLNARTQLLVGGRVLTSTLPSGITQLDPTVLPLVVSRTQAAVASLAVRLTPRFDLVTALDATHVRFDADGFVGGSTGGALVRVTSRADRGATYGMVLDGRAASFDSLSVASARMEGELGLRRLAWTGQIRAGGTLVQPDAIGASSTFSPTGSVELAHRTRLLSASAQVSRSVQPAFGFGRVLNTNVAGVAVEVGNPRRLVARLAGDASRASDPASNDFDFTFTSLSGELRWPVGGGLTVALGGVSRRRVQGLPFTNSGLSLTARFTTPR